MSRKSRFRKVKKKPDYTLVITILILVVVGLVVLSSASAVLSYDRFGSNYYFFTHQLVYGALFGMIAFFVTSQINYHYWKKLAAFMLIATIFLLIVVFIPGLGLEHGGARRWINIGSFTFQPTELAKLTFLLYLSTWLDKRQKGIKDWKYGFVPFVTILGVISFLIILQPDVGTMSVIIVTAISIYFVAGAKFSHLALLGASGVAMFIMLIKIAPYRMARLTVFLNPEIDPQGIGYQINQALLAIGSGGLFGRGLGKSIQKYNYLPEASGDSIFAIIAEELGFVRILLLIGLFMVLTIRGFNVAKKSPDFYGKLIATGITSWICFQAFLNMAAISGLMPLTGIPLPFISYGGSALLISLASMGILVNISKHMTEK